MNLFARRCGCGAIFALVHLRDRSQQCTACQRKAAARLHRQAVHTAALKVKYSKRLPPAAVHLCEGDFEQVGHCMMPPRTLLEQLESAMLRRVYPCP